MLDDEEQILSQAITDKNLAYMREDDHLQEGIIANSTVLEDQQILLPHIKSNRPLKPQSLHRPPVEFIRTNENLTDNTTAPSEPLKILNINNDTLTNENTPTKTSNSSRSLINNQFLHHQNTSVPSPHQERINQNHLLLNDQIPQLTNKLKGRLVSREESEDQNRQTRNYEPQQNYYHILPKCNEELSMELSDTPTLHAGDISSNTVGDSNNNFDPKIQTIDNDNSYNVVMDICSNEDQQHIKNPTDIEIRNHVNNAPTNLPECELSKIRRLCTQKDSCAEPNSNLIRSDDIPNTPPGNCLFHCLIKLCNLNLSTAELRKQLLTSSYIDFIVVFQKIREESCLHKQSGVTIIACLFFQNYLIKIFVYILIYQTVTRYFVIL